MTRFGGESLVPGIQAERATVEAQLYFGRIEQQYFQGGILEAATLDPGQIDQTSQLRPGLILAQIRSTGLLTEWNPYSTVPGVNIISGFLNHHIDLTLDGVTQNRFTNLIMYGGNIKSDSIIVPSTALNDPGEFDGNDWEFIIRDQLKHRFIFDDDVYGEYTAPKTLVDATADLTLIAEDNMTLVSNQGSAVPLALTLPDPLPGLHFETLQIGLGGTGQDIDVDTVGAGTDFIDATEDLGALVAIDALDFGKVTFDGVRSTATLYSYVVNRSAS